MGYGSISGVQVYPQEWTRVWYMWAVLTCELNMECLFEGYNSAHLDMEKAGAHLCQLPRLQVMPVTQRNCLCFCPHLSSTPLSDCVWECCVTFPGVT